MFKAFNNLTYLLLFKEHQDLDFAFSLSLAGASPELISYIHTSITIARRTDLTETFFQSPAIPRI